MKQTYPDLPPGHGAPYGGIENLRPESQALVDSIVFAQGLTRKSE